MPINPLLGEPSVIALVTYIPSPLGTFLDELRNSFPGQKGGQAHLTFLAPRPLSGPAGTARSLIASKLKTFRAFDVELTEVLRFPTTNVIYIGLGQGSEEAHQLHDTLNAGPLAHAERYDYRPHISLVFPPEEAAIDSIELAAAETWNASPLPKRFRVDSIDFLQNTNDGAWKRLWSWTLPA